jgi:hypothetical protein
MRFGVIVADRGDRGGAAGLSHRAGGKTQSHSVSIDVYFQIVLRHLIRIGAWT